MCVIIWKIFPVLILDDGRRTRYEKRKFTTLQMDGHKSILLYAKLDYTMYTHKRYGWLRGGKSSYRKIDMLTTKIDSTPKGKLLLKPYDKNPKTL